VTGERKRKKQKDATIDKDDIIEDDLEDEDLVADSALTKDQRTVFVSQLVMRADERDVKRYFIKLLRCKVNEVVILRDKRSGRHKGCAYVELGRLSDVQKALEANNTPPDFQRFPILIKASEAEKNYVVSSSQTTLTAKQMGARGGAAAPMINEATGKVMEAQKVYLGNLDPAVTQKILYSIFSQFGHLEKVSVQMDPTVGASRGFCFLSFRDPKDANLAIQTMAGQVLAGRPLYVPSVVVQLLLFPFALTHLSSLLRLLFTEKLVGRIRQQRSLELKL
jgi:RNA-binding protein 39